MKIYPISDLHLDHNGLIAEVLHFEPDLDSVVVLAGDLCSWAVFDQKNGRWESTETPRSLLHDTVRYFAERCRHVLIVLGNHDYNGTILDPNSFRYSNLKVPGNPCIMDLYDFDYLGNVKVLQQGDSFTMGDTIFIGATLWTDIFKADPYLCIMAPTLLRCDFESTRVKAGRDLNTVREMRAEHWMKMHQSDKEGLGWSVLRAHSERKKICVITHMPPFHLSIGKDYYGHPSNAFFHCTDMDGLAGQVDMIIHGHVHSASDYMAGDTRVICNAYGYGNEWTRNGFILDLQVEL